MKQLILEKSKWVNANNTTERGPSCLLNKSGYMCCLGQFSLQLDSIVTKDMIFELGTPYSLKTSYNIVIDSLYDIVHSNNSRLTLDAILINDDNSTNEETKIHLLTELFKEHGYEIIVKE